MQFLISQDLAQESMLMCYMLVCYPHLPSLLINRCIRKRNAIEINKNLDPFAFGIRPNANVLLRSPYIDGSDKKPLATVFSFIRQASTTSLEHLTSQCSTFTLE